MASFGFKILKRSKKSEARLGIIKTPHGDIKTPAFVPCGTKGTVKSLTPEDLEAIGTQCVFVNTYHIVLSPGVDVVERTGGIHKFSRIDKPIITDSGGFQVFSLARIKSTPGVLPLRSLTLGVKNLNKTPGVKERNKRTPGVEYPHIVKITDDGVEFRSHIDGSVHHFTPEFSIKAQRKIGADLVVAFDECVHYEASRKYTERAMKRTHDWARRSLEAFGKPPGVSRPEPSREGSSTPRVKKFKLEARSYKLKANEQQLYGVIQGGMYKDLRQESAQFITSLPFFGLGIGGVSVGETKREMRDQIKWVMDTIKDDPRPRHLFGVGEIDDIFDMIKMGIDTFDCVIPTRHARMGKLYRITNTELRITSYEMIDIFKSKFKKDLSPVDKNCHCYTCANFTRAYLHHLFKQRELLAYRLATIHNLYYMEKLFKNIRDAISKDRFQKLY